MNGKGNSKGETRNYLQGFQQRILGKQLLTLLRDDSQPRQGCWKQNSQIYPCRDETRTPV